MSPQRVIRTIRTHKRFTWIIVVCCLMIFAAFIATASRLTYRADAVNDEFVDQATLIYQNCVANETQDSVIVAQLEAAKRRARASLPRGSAELLYQMEVLNEGIDALEPPNEPDCVPPEGTDP
jgi:hypothetical protein